MDYKVVDIHSHILPGVDDGAIDLDISKEMIKVEYKEGCRHLFLTPHAYSFNYRRLHIDRKIKNLKDWIKKENINMNIYKGSEVYIDWDDEIDNTLHKIRKRKYPTLNDTNYLLIEFNPAGFVTYKIASILNRIISYGLIPVIAHVEKYDVSYDYLCELKKMGCFMQMNLCDVYFKWENEVSERAGLLLSDKMIDFVGTDAHGIDRRTPEMSVYIEYLYNNYEKDYIDGILYKNAIRFLLLSDG